MLIKKSKKREKKIKRKKTEDITKIINFNFQL